MKTRIANMIRAGFPLVKIRTPEEIRALAIIKDSVDFLGEIGKPRKDGIWAWSITRGAVNVTTGQTKSDLADPIVFLEMIREYQPSEAVFVALDMDLKDPILQRKIKDMIPELRSGRPIILIDIGTEIPASLEPFITVIDLPLPDSELLKKVAREVTEGDVSQEVISALSGLTSDAASDALALSIIERGKPDHQFVMQEKAKQLSRHGFLQVIPRESLPKMEDIGGLENLKRFLVARRDAFSSRAKEFRLPEPKGVLIAGVPGCGKSLAVKCAGDILGLPVIKLDIGAIMGRYVGQSEQNWRTCTQVAEAMAPCVLWVDELDKQFSTGGTGEQHEVTARVMSGMLTWMQEKTAPVFVCATANRIQKLSESYPEILRLGRWDELFFVDLPNLQERNEIIKIHIGKLGRNPADYDIDRIAEETKNFSGAEIEGAIRKAAYLAFEQRKEIGQEHIIGAVLATIPQWEQSKQSISSLRDWIRSRAVPASVASEEKQKRQIQK